MTIRLIPTPAVYHQCNGAVERYNHKIRYYYNCLLACDNRSTIAYVRHEAAYGKNINQGIKIVSGF